MAESNARYILEPGGAIIRETVSRERVRMLDEMLDKCKADVTLEAHNILPIGNWGIASLRQSADQFWWTIPLNRIPIRSNYRLMDKVMVPDFGYTGGKVMHMNWTPPAGMRLRLLVYIPNRKDKPPIYESVYLYAYTDTGTAFLLPLPNLYEDCRVCDGQRHKQNATHADCLIEALEGLETSKWNTDLWEEKDKTFGMFRWAPNNEGFEQQPPTNNNWTVFCKKVSTAAMKWVML